MIIKNLKRYNINKIHQKSMKVINTEIKNRLVYINISIKWLVMDSD